MLYHDHVTSDSRLTLAVLDGAAQAGALVLNHVEVVGLQTLGGRVTGADAVDRRTGDAIEVRARVVVNAAGPWIDRVRRLERPDAGTTVQLSRGTHLVLGDRRPLAGRRHGDAGATAGWRSPSRGRTACCSARPTTRSTAIRPTSRPTPATSTRYWPRRACR